jgi:hypothetical protein
VKQKLNAWEQSCLESLHKLDTTKRVEDKLYFYYEGPLEIVTEGYVFIEELSKCKDEALKKMADALAEIKVSFESSRNWFEKCVRVTRGKYATSVNELKELDDEDNCDVNPFLDCTSSEIVLGANSFLNHNTSL